MEEATHRISACYFPGTEEVELTFEDLVTGKRAGATFKCDKETGNAIADAVPCAVYHDAVVEKKK